MAITTMSGLKDGLQPPFHYIKGTVSGEAAHIFSTSFYTAGSPAAAVAPTPGLNGAALTAYAGQIPWVNPASGNGYVAAVNGGHWVTSMSVNQGYSVLCDRLWHNSGIDPTVTTEQAITSPTWPARDRNGATNGDGVLVGIEVSATMGNGAISNTTLNYTNSAGTSGRTATIAVTSTIVTSTFVFFSLQAGDVGIRSVQGLTLGTTYVSGTMHLVALRPLCDWNSTTISDHQMLDAISIGFPRVFDDSVLFVLASGAGGTVQPQMNTIVPAHG